MATRRPRELSETRVERRIRHDSQLVKSLDLPPAIGERIEADAAERANDEAVAAKRWLLTKYPDGLEARRAYYIWSVLRETVLRPTYLPWASTLETTARAHAFGDKAMHDSHAISHQD